ncbi:DUF3102 domain-containing protein [Methylobacterium sp. WL12]|uniref:DUF3102 domain-containing protein n=1 Tax=Methylobacterium sp. WL12 TaxID=2603890 RepID=UPI001650B828|nr:DUF3102 domain-containing protein [Methylobacterium sp. WL12]
MNVPSDEISAAVAAVESSPELRDLARRINERELLAKKHAHVQWLENGRDLLNAKAVIGHGNFEEWCERELNYTPRTAQKLMRAAEVWGPILKTESSSVIPKPTIVYALSAPSVSQEIRDTYVPRVIAGEEVGTELRIAIKGYRDAVKKVQERESRLAAKSPEAQKAQVQREQAKARRETRAAEQRQTEREQHQIEQERQATARSAALALIMACFGDDLPSLVALIAEAGPGSVFSYIAEREWHALVQGEATSVQEGAGTVVDELKFADVGTVKTFVARKHETHPWSMPPSTIDDKEAIGPLHDEPVSNDKLPSLPRATPLAGAEKLSDFLPTKSAFPIRPLGSRAECMHSRSRVQSNTKPGGSLGRPARPSA